MNDSLMNETGFERYGFKCGTQGSGTDFRYIVYGDARRPGDHTVGGKFIIDLYNKVKYPRGKVELEIMNQLNSAYHRRQIDELRSLISSTKRRSFTKVSQQAEKMWKAVLDLYESTLA